MDKVTNLQLFFIVLLRISAGSVLSLPLIMAQKAETGSWFVLLIASFITCIPITIIAYLGSKFQGKTLFEYSQMLVGKPLTYLFSLAYIVYYFCVVVLITRTTADIIKSEILIKTPIYATLFLFIIFTGYAASKKLSGLGRIFEFLGIIIMITSIILHLIMFFKGDIQNAQPFFEIYELNMYLKALPATIFIYIGFEAITIIPFSKSNANKAIRICILAVLATGLVFIYISEATYMILGIEDVVNYNFPNISAIRRLDLPALQFFKRLDLIFINTWIFSLFCSLSFAIYTVTQYTNKIFTKLNFNFILSIVCIAAFIVGLLPQSAEQVSGLLRDLTTYFGFITALLIPLILLITAKVKKYV